ncbi:MAG: hypothetical protein JWO06_1294 [Bacteroidota bacterium]|nr:hypothetical protein [Bacteroidota bacterium]
MRSLSPTKTNHLIRYLLFVVICLLFAHSATAQSHTDTLKLAQQYRDQHKLIKAAKLFSAYHKHHPEDINALWLYAQTEYWRDHYRRSKKLYEQAVAMRPDNDYLQLDYGKAMLDLGDWKSADSAAQKVEHKGKGYSEEKILRARLSYNSADYAEARTYIDEAIKKENGSIKAWNVYDQIEIAKSPWLKLSTTASADNQPLYQVSPAAEAGIYLHKLATIQLGFYSPVFIVNGKVSSAQWLVVGDKAALPKVGLEIGLNVGVVKYPFNNKTGWSGSFYFDKIFVRHLNFELIAEHKPYFYTISSLESVVSVNHFSFAGGWNDKNTWNGKAAFDFNYYNDKNYTYAAYGWLYAPPIKFSVIELRFGYSYSYSNSKENHYSPEQSLTQIIANYSSTTQIAGVYNPYFTPQQQYIHSGLVALAIYPVKKLEINLNASVGFYAYAQNPYLYLDKNETGATVIARGFERTTYLPFEVGASLEWQLSRKVVLTAQYAYRSTYFFNSHNAAVGLKISFWNDRKK